MMDQRRTALQAAELYYFQDLTMDAVARELGTSRSTVSRLISFAKQEGLVEIRLNTSTVEPGYLQEELARRFRVRAFVVSMPNTVSDIERLDRLTINAARLLNQFIESNTTVGLAWGSTISAVSRHLLPKPTRSTRFVQLNGAGNTQTTGITYASEILSRFARNYEATAQQFPVPTLFDEAETKRAMWRERSTRRVLDVQAGMSVALFSVGSALAKVPSQVYVGGYLDAEELAELREHKVVGDIATIFYREDGSAEGIPVNARSSGPELSVLRRTARRICIAADASKAPAVRGALAGELVTDLIVDESLARALLD